MRADTLRSSLWRLMGLEMCLVLGIVVLCIAACLHEVRAVLHKVGLVGPMLALAEARGASMERLALTGALEHDATAAAGLALRPVILRDGLDAHVLWLCGKRRAPAGWSGPGQPADAGLTAQQLPAACRGAME